MTNKRHDSVEGCGVEKTNFILNGMSCVVGWSARNPYKMFAVIVAITMVLGYGMTMIKTTSDQTDILPKDDPNTIAAKKVSNAFPEFYTTVGFYNIIDPEKFDKMNTENLPNRVNIPGMMEPNKDNVTDELYLRGLHEFYLYMESKVPATKYEIGPSAAVMICNWSNSAMTSGTGEPVESAFSMPDTSIQGELQFALDAQLLLSDPQIHLSFSKDYKCVSMNMIFDPESYELTSAELGKQIIAAMDEWPSWAAQNAKFAAFKWEETTANQVPVADGRSAQLTEKDNRALMPFVFGFLIASLWIAFRRLSYVVIGMVSLVVATVWTLGVMGYVGIPFTSLNQTIIPLLLGCGIDYSLHMITQYMQNRSLGFGKEQALRIATGRSGFSMFLSTTTTIIGMSTLLFSPSVMMQQLGIVAPLGMVLALVVNLTMTPAALTAFSKDGSENDLPKFVPAKRLTRLSDAVGKHKLASILIVLMITAGAYVSSRDLKYEEFGDPQLNFLPGDKVRVWRELENENFYGGISGGTTKTANFFIVQGDMTQPHMHDYLRRLGENLKLMPDQKTMLVMCLPWIIDSYLLIKQGTAGAGTSTIGSYIEAYGGPDTQLTPDYPNTQADIKQTLDDMMPSPIGTQASLLLSEDYSIAIISVDVLQEPGFAGVKKAWNAVWAAVEKTDGEVGRPEGTEVSFYGLTAASYLFIALESQWVSYVSIVSSIAVVILVLLFTRNLKATLIVGAMMTMTTVWWFGVLPLVGIGISVTLMLPVTFIMCMGSDYAVHFIWNLAHTPDRQTIYHSIGKSVMFSAATTIGAFVIFSFMSNLMSRKAMASVWLATVMSFICTLLVVSIFYPPYPASAVQKRPEQKWSSIEQNAANARTVKVARLRPADANIPKDAIGSTDRTDPGDAK